MSKPDISQERLRRLFVYDPETGMLIWQERPRSDFASLRAYRVWNAHYAGKVAGWTRPDGCHLVGIDNTQYRAHRLIWKMTHGVWPVQIDHEHGIRSDNRIIHLRDVSDGENKKNMPMPSTNTSGVIGVCWDRQVNKWRAQIWQNNKCKTLGVFDDKSVAIARRKAAEIDLGYHPNHGRIVR